MIKKVTILSLAIFLFSKSQAQLIKGTYLIGGTGSFNHEKNGDSKHTDFNIDPKVGYFLKNKFAVGVGGSLKGYSNKNQFGKYSTTIYGVGPFVRYYFLPEDKKINLLVEGNLMYNYSKDNSGFTSKGWSYGAMAGPVLYLNKSVGLELLLGYRRTKIVNNFTEGGFGVNVGFQIHLNNGSKK